MSAMYDESPLPSGKAYSKDGWREYAIHDDTQVFGFFGDYRWLSNFEPAPCWYRGLQYANTEAAYQAAKLLPRFRDEFTDMLPAAAKRVSRQFGKDQKMPDWDNRERKIDVMREVTLSKYIVNRDLRQKLLETGERNLVEACHWGDVFWGYCVHTNRGDNELGEIIMATRRFFQ